MSKKYRNPATGEVFTLEEEDEEASGTPAKKAAHSAEQETPDTEEDETAEDAKPKADFSWTPFDVLDSIDGKDVEKIALGAAIGIGGVLAIKGLCSFFSRD